MTQAQHKDNIVMVWENVSFEGVLGMPPHLFQVAFLESVAHIFYM